MNDPLALMLAGIAGCLLGGFFFGGLWWTVRKGISCKRPVLWFLGSLLLRSVVTLIGFYFVGRGHWKRMLACLVGFIIARLIVLLMKRSTAGNPIHPKQEMNNASESR